MKIVLPNMQLWRHDLCECLHNCIGTMLLYHQQDPVFVLGAVWDFYYPPGDVRREEYYYPCRWPSLVGSLAPYHPITSQWHKPIHGEQGWSQVKDAIRRGKPAIVAVDNYYLPFRPAYQDVHTNHLIVVYGFDEEVNTVFVLDASPPSFKGTIRTEELQAARNSENPAVHERDLFFTNVPIANRWLDVEIGDTFPTITEQWVKSVLSTNVQCFRTVMDGPAFSGTAGMAYYFGDWFLGAVNEKGTSAMDELVLVSVAFQEATALHADFLRAVGQRLDWAELVEVSRAVDLVAHDCTPIRIMAAKGRLNPEEMRPHLAYRFHRLLSDHEKALRDLEWIIDRS